MKKTKFLAAIGGLGLAALSVFLIAADHIDAPAVAGTSTDITDFYAFQGENPDNLVFVANVQGLLAPGQPTEQAIFDENVLVEFNIDKTNDLVEDELIQAIKRNDSMYFFMPTTNSQTGLTSTINAATQIGVVKISTTTDVQTSTNDDGFKFFAGPREDPFFFDFVQYGEILAGNAPGGFNNPGSDTFAGTNVLSIVVEVPKSKLGSPTPGANPLNPSARLYNAWVEAKRKQ
ncbi:DUF4331 family protein [Ulvibacter litoralis]|uniref:Molecular chaperone DnaK n=1 Tax=Ulvibacter litoralis TaxID=227084 RepID=A0A1G7F039_9FLAO|nr:DUF4331 family protein [Ulvibacter litoralis]GHC53237.1 hypothetical protein GCM10008083_16520 [Ulvibacter litoralis]SDE69308.1 protein of unknown function [Ulvibacter litoralis]